MENKPLEPKRKLSPLIANWLREQLEFWTNKGILNEVQKENIDNLYIWPEHEVPPPSVAKPSTKLITVLEIIGTFLVGIGVISFIAYNWPWLQNLTKLIIIFASVLSIHLIGFFILAFRPKFPKTGLSLIFLGNILYGAGIWLIAQIYHIHHSFPTGVFMWALGVVPFAYVVRSKINYFLALALFIIWTIGESIGFQQPHLYFLFILLALLIPLSYYLKSKVGLILCLISGGVWLLINNIFWFEERISVYLFLPMILYGVILLSTSNLHLVKDTFKEYRRIYLYIGTTIFLITLFFMPLFGMIKLSPQALTLNNLSVSFWLCSGLMLVGSLIFNTFINKEYLDSAGLTINKILPYLIASGVYIFIMPHFKPLLIPTLLPILLVALAYRHFSGSRILLNLMLIYLSIWLPFCLISWKQPLLLFLLFLIYGTMCYILGWSYISNFQDKIWGNIFKFFGLLIIFISLYTFTTSQMSEIFAKNFKFPGFLDFWALVLFFYAGAIFLYKYIARFTYPLQKKGMLPEEGFIIPVLCVAPIILFLIFSIKSVGFWFIFLMNFSYLC